MVIEYNSVYDEFAIFLANLSPRKILTYRSSAKAQERVKILLEKNKKEGLNDAENAEIQGYMTIEHIVRLAKAKAMQKLSLLVFL